MIKRGTISKHSQACNQPVKNAYTDTWGPKAKIIQTSSNNKGESGCNLSDQYFLSNTYSRGSQTTIDLFNTK